MHLRLALLLTVLVAGAAAAQSEIRERRDSPGVLATSVV